ncbi:MAG: glycosyltransferase family 4 protein [Hyphomicrobiaceae bacterium]
MHILFLTDNFPPEVNAPASRSYEHCRDWVRQGHKVTVITGAPNFPAGRVFKGYKNRLWSRETVDGIGVIRVWTFITANAGTVLRTIDYASFMAAAFPAALLVRNVDIVVGTSPQLFTPCAGLAAAVLKRRPFVFELRDLWPASIKAVGAMGNSRILSWLEALEMMLYRNSDHIVSVTNAFRENLVERGIPRDKISVTMNGADLSRFRPQSRDEELAAKLGLKGKFVAGYVGTLGMAHGLATIVEAARLVQARPDARDIHFLLLGDGAEKEPLKKLCAESGITNVTFLDSVPRSEVARYWSLLDVSIVHLKRQPLFTTVIPSKLFECMAMGIPVLHGVEGESAELVEHEGFGLAFEPENAAALTERLLELARAPDLRRELSRRGIEAAPRHDRSHLAHELLETLARVAAAHSGRLSPA